MYSFRHCFFVFGALLICGSHAAAESLPAFKGAEEMVDGWYHRIEKRAWRRSGISDETSERVLQRIAGAEGERANPEWVDSIVEYGPGHWVYEWSAEGDRVFAEAEDAAERGRKPLAAGLFRQARALYTIASWPHLNHEHDRAALARARVAYMRAAEFVPAVVEHRTFAVGDHQTKGYLHLPPGDGAYPAVVFSYGSDVTKEDGLSFFRHELLPRGIGLLSVDLPGIGEAAHIPLLDGSESVLKGGAAFLRQHPRVDAKRIFVIGGSFGGNAAAATFLTTEGLAGVASVCGPLHQPFVAPPQVYDALPALTMDGVKARLGILGQSSERLAELAPNVSIVERGLIPQTPLRTPLFVLTTNRDPVAPLDDLPLLANAAENYEQVVLDIEGHCPPRWVRQPILARWMDDVMREE